MSILDSLIQLFRAGTEKPSPSDIVPEDNIRYSITAGMLSISLTGINIPFTMPPRVWIPFIPDTNSMDGAFDYGNNNILIQGFDSENQKIMLNFIKVGDICVYRIPLGTNPYGFYAIHRIVKMGKDSKGRWFRFKGDNVGWLDPYISRDVNVEWLAIGTIF